MQLTPRSNLSVTEQEIQAELRHQAIKSVVDKKLVDQLLAGFQEIEKEEHIVSDIVMNANTFENFRAMHEYIDYEMNAPRLRQGLFGYLFGARLWVNRELAYGEVRFYREGDPNFGRDFPGLHDASAPVQVSEQPESESIDINPLKKSRYEMIKK